MFVKRWMTQNVITVKKGSTLKEAASLMWHYRIRHLPVLEGNKVVGMLDDRALLYIDPRNLDSDIFQIQPMLEKIVVEDVMNRKVPVVSPDTNFEAVVTIMINKKVSAIPVIESGKLVGIICEDDLFRAFAEITGLKEQGLRFSLKMKASSYPMLRISEILEKFHEEILGVLTYKSLEDPEDIRITFQVKPEGAPDILRFLESNGYQTEDLLKLFENVFAN
jgi:acetoin utilization protein AcuB